MRLLKYIGESNKDFYQFVRNDGPFDRVTKFDVDLFTKTWKQVEKDCRPFLSEIRRMRAGTYLYRGIGGADNKGVKTVRKDRRPLDTSENVTNIVDEYFQKKIGWKPRTQGLFTTGDMSFSVRYGDPYIIFPIGVYKILWYKKVKDTIGIFGNSTISFELFKEYKVKLKDATEEQIKYVVYNQLEKYKYNTSNLKDAIKSLNEIVINTDKYYYFSKYKFDDMLTYAVWGDK